MTSEDWGRCGIPLLVLIAARIDLRGMEKSGSALTLKTSGKKIKYTSVVVQATSVKVD